MHWTRRGISVVELWTTEDDRVVLGMAELSKVLTLVTGELTAGQLISAQAASTSRARCDQSIRAAAAAPSPVGSSCSARR